MKKELVSILKVYIASWFISLIIFVIGFMISGVTFIKSLEYFGEALTHLNFEIAIHSFFFIIYLFYLITRYFLRTLRKKGTKIMLRQLSFRFVIPVLFVYSIFKLIIMKNSYEDFQYSWIPNVENQSGISNDLYQIDKKHRGMNVFGWNDNYKTAIDDLIRSNIEWVAMVPFIDQKNEASLNMSMPDRIGKWSRRDSVHMRTIKALKNRNIHIMLKPHIWLTNGWRSNINYTNTTDWNTWFESYRKNIIHYAKMAAKTDVELFCIGTELKSSLKAQPDQWKSLIKEIKTIYKGKLTYAANWDGEYEFIDFWNELDYIGIQAYFPLTKEPSPNLQMIKNGWKKYIPLLEALSQKHRKPLLFTEVGYKSEVSSTIKPWEWGSAISILSKQKSDETQQIAYQALYEELWDKEWFAGTYIWQWNTQTKKENTKTNLDFSPRYKPAENTIAKWYTTKSHH